MVPNSNIYILAGLFAPIKLYYTQVPNIYDVLNHTLLGKNKFGQAKNIRSNK